MLIVKRVFMVLGLTCAAIALTLSVIEVADLGNTLTWAQVFAYTTLGLAAIYALLTRTVFKE